MAGVGRRLASRGGGSYNGTWKRGQAPFCKAPSGRSGKRSLSPFPHDRQPAIPPGSDLIMPAETRSDCYERPLRGRRVMVTRPGLEKGTGPICRNGPEAGTDAQRWSSHKLDLSPFPDPLAEQLRELGAEVIVQPAIRIGPPADWRAGRRCPGSAGSIRLAGLFQRQRRSVSIGSTQGENEFCRLFQGR